MQKEKPRARVGVLRVSSDTGNSKEQLSSNCTCSPMVSRARACREIDTKVDESSKNSDSIWRRIAEVLASLRS